MEISKCDWKLFRERLPERQEHYMEQLTKEYMKLLSAPGYASDHFWELEKRIKKDKFQRFCDCGAVTLQCVAVQGGRSCIRN